MIFGGAGLLAAIIVVVSIVAFSGSSKPKDTPTPAPTVTANLPAYASQLSSARTIFDEAMQLYKAGKAKEDPKAQAKGIQKALDRLDVAINMLQPLADKYTDANKNIPADLDKFLTQMYEQRQLWAKSKPMNVLD
jgi:hypothetical protein